MCSVSTPDMASIPLPPPTDNDPLRDVILKDRDSVRFQSLAMRGYRTAFLSGPRGNEGLPALAPPQTAPAPAATPATPAPRVTDVRGLLWKFLHPDGTPDPLGWSLPKVSVPK